MQDINNVIPLNNQKEKKKTSDKYNKNNVSKNDYVE